MLEDNIKGIRTVHENNPHDTALMRISVRDRLPWLFFLFMTLKAFYLQTSGNVGMADICLMGCFFLLAEVRVTRKQCTFREGYFRKPWFSEDRLLYVFLTLVALINSLYGARHQNLEFIKYSVFWIYNGCAIWTWRVMAGQYGRSFFKLVNIAAKINITIQFIIWVLGRGRIYYEYWGAVRYMGTFNNPLQLAFFLFMMLLLIWLYRCRFGDRSFWIFLLLSFPVLADTKSVGIWLGLAIWLFSCMIYKICLLWESGRLTGRTLVIGGICLVMVSVLTLYLIWPPADFDICTVDYNLLTRIQEKIWKVMNGGFKGLVLDRAAGRLFLHPKYLLFGAGEGGFERFTDSGPAIELHSTWLSLWFCYGIVPAILMALWLRKVLKANTPWMRCAIGGLVAESFFLINYRQPMFWMILLYADVSDGLEDQESEEWLERSSCLSDCLHTWKQYLCRQDKRE